MLVKYDDVYTNFSISTMILLLLIVKQNPQDYLTTQEK